MIEREDYEAFMDRVAEEAIPETAEEVWGIDARGSVELSEPLSPVELYFVVRALVTAHHHASKEGNLFAAAMYHRLVEQLKHEHDFVGQEVERVNKMQQNPLMALFKQGMEGGFGAGEEHR